jgi:lysophospholipase L1-like esterase
MPDLTFLIVPLVLLLALVGGGGLALRYVIGQMSKPPDNAPEHFWGRRVPGQRVVVCLGASLVHGRVGVNFVDMLAARFPEIAFVNAGVNGDTAYHAQQRLEAAIACQPDDVVILIGTNDAICMLNPDRWKVYTGAKALPRPPSLDGYRDTLRAIVRQVKEQTGARVALCALPVLGEDLNTPANARIREFNAVIGQVAAEEGTAYLPIYDDDVAYLQAHGQGAGHAFRPNAQESLRLGFLANVQHYLLGRSFDDIARRRGLLLTTDLTHCNTPGATIIANRIAAFLTSGTDPAPAHAQQPAHALS